MKSYFKLARPHHWLKNAFVFLPLFFSGEFLNTALLIKALFAFLAFGFISSVVYVINDIADRDKDANHPTKKNRPIASGAVSPRAACVFAALLIVLSAACGILAAGSALMPYVYLIAYLLINICYSAGAKNVPILDVAILAAGYLIRLIFGSAVVGIEISGWLYLTVMSAAFYLGLGKRRNELGKSKDTRVVLKYYNYAFLDKMMYMFMAMAIVFYSLWSMEGMMIWTVPFIVLICMRYSLIIEGESDADPMEVIIKDKLLLALCAVYAVLTFLLIYRG